MTELREELERQFKAYGLLNPQPENEATKNPEMQVVETVAVETVPVEQATAEITAPVGYDEKFASDFKNLPVEWQDFLCRREAEQEQKLNECNERLSGYQSLEKQFEQDRERLYVRGFQKVQDWLKALVDVDEALDSNPAETVQAIAAVYGVPVNVPQRCGVPVSPEMVARLCNLERSYHNLTEYLQGLQKQRLIDSIRMYGRQTDADGKVLHPHFDEVKNDVFGLLSCGLVDDVDEAYQQALWLNPKVRTELIAQHINSKTIEAEKAKKAAFAPKGKTQAPQRALTLREELEKNMAALLG